MKGEIEFVFCNPCGPSSVQEREEMLTIIQQFPFDPTSNQKGKFGYPISKKVELALEQTKASLILHTKKVLNEFQGKLLEHMQAKPLKNLKGLQADLQELDLWLAKLEKPTLSSFTQEYYKSVSEPLVY